VLRHEIPATQAENPPAWGQNVLRVGVVTASTANPGAVASPDTIFAQS
jgi:hypothetical protein